MSRAVLASAMLVATTVGAAAEALQMPERARKIAVAMEKIGLVPKGQMLPEAIGGYRLEATIGVQKPGQKWIRIFVHIGEPAKVQKVYDYAVAGQPAASPFVAATGWTGSSASGLVDVRTMGPFISTLPGYDNHITGGGSASGLDARRDALVTVQAERYDQQTFSDFVRSVKDADYKAAAIARSAALDAGLKADAENWLRTIAVMVDQSEVGAAPPRVEPPTAANAPETRAKPPTPPPPSTTPVSATATAMARDVMGRGPRPRSLIGPRIEGWIKENRDWAVANPVKAAGSCMMAVGVGLLATATAPWTGAALIVGGIGAYQSTKPRSPPPEIPAVREAREKLKKYQEDWKQGFSDAELNELGIYLDDLSKLSKEQRMQVYKDADIEFTNRADALRAMREAEARERGGK